MPTLVSILNSTSTTKSENTKEQGDLATLITVNKFYVIAHLPIIRIIWFKTLAAESSKP